MGLNQRNAKRVQKLNFNAVVIIVQRIICVIQQKGASKNVIWFVDVKIKNKLQSKIELTSMQKNQGKSTLTSGRSALGNA